MLLRIQKTFLIVALMFCGALTLLATPYAGGIVVTGGTVSFLLNEDAPDVAVAFDANTSSLDLGPLTRGPNSFPLGAHTNFSIIVTKSGSGAVTQISADSNRYL